MVLKNTKLFIQGIYVAIGLFLGNVVIIPLLSDRPIGSGVLRGAVTAGIVIVIFLAMALLKSEKSETSEGG